MKKLITFIVFSIISISLIAQDLAYDVIYPLNKKKAIVKCQILEITEGNLVLYMLDGIDYEIKAIAVKRNGEYIDLKEFDIEPIIEPSSNNDKLPEFWSGEDYNYYFGESKKAKKLKATGMFFTALGLGSSVLGFSRLRKYNGANGISYRGSISTSLLIITGSVTLNIGIPLWIAGGIKDSNNKKAMKKCKKPDASLNIGVSADGVGLVYRF